MAEIFQTLVSTAVVSSALGEAALMGESGGSSACDAVRPRCITTTGYLQVMNFHPDLFCSKVVLLFNHFLLFGLEISQGLGEVWTLLSSAGGKPSDST